MKDQSIVHLLRSLTAEYGEEGVRRYVPDDDHGVCVIIDDIPATFSIITLDGTLPPDVYSIQVEDHPFDSYIYIDDSIALEALMQLIRRYSRHIDYWPLMEK